MKSGDCETAVQLLGESQSLDPAVGTALNMAICEEKLGRLRQALEHFEFVIARAPVDDARRRFAKQRASELERRVAWLTVTVPRGMRTAPEVVLDGKPLQANVLRDPVRLDPGLHELTLRDSERIVFQERLNLREGERRVWAPVLTGTDEPADRESKPRRRTRTGRPTSRAPGARDGGPPTLGYVSIGVGTAAVAASLVFGLLVMDKNEVVKRSCDADGCDQTGVDAADAGRTFSMLSTISAAIGVPALAFGGYLLLSYEPPKSSDQRAAAQLTLILPTH